MLSTKTIVVATTGILTAAGLALLGASFAGAEQTTTAGAAYGYDRGGRPSVEEAPTGNQDPSKPQRPDEQLLTGETADKVTAAARAKEPTATIERVETDSDGVYEAHMVRSDGTHVIVQVGADFQVTDVVTGGPGGGRHGQGQQPPAGAAPQEAPPASGSTASS